MTSTAVTKAHQAKLISTGNGRAPKVMVKVLACVPTHGLETVLVAVELVLESGVPSLEHIRNVVSRLKEPVPP